MTPMLLRDGDKVFIGGVWHTVTAVCACPLPAHGPAHGPLCVVVVTQTGPDTHHGQGSHLWATPAHVGAVR